MAERTPAGQAFIRPELLTTAAILIGLVGIVSLVLVGVTTREERLAENHELAVVQSAIIIFMEQNQTQTLTPRTRANAGVINPADSDAPFTTYIYTLPTRCSYYWTYEGEVSQTRCP